MIGEENDKAVGFLAMRVDAAGKQVFGIAIPDGAFIEVPGQGFEKRRGELRCRRRRLARGGVELPERAVPELRRRVRRRPIAICSKSQQVGLIGGAIKTTESHSTEQRGPTRREFSRDTGKSAAFVPLPVKPIKLGEPDLLRAAAR